jgi:alkanesulfonate monooxygenase SsuD/methylene tetrahydromethanopterin reductase-like flavin-dependent oxidoreductase (luciferase family)
MIFEAQTADASRRGEAAVLRSCVDQAVLAEEMGFDRVWAVEHHALRWYAHMSAPEIFLSWVAARTSRIRIGHGVVCMPFNYNHPVRVAERAAMLDNLSGGRLDVGAGRGATLQETTLCGVDPTKTKDEVEEALHMFSAMWTDDSFRWDGSFDIAPHTIVPRPFQDPHPPLFLACNKKDTITLAAEYGVGALVLGFSGLDEVAALRKIYADGLATRDGSKFVSTVQNDHVSALCPTILLDDADEAFRIGVRGQRFFQESIAHWHLGLPEPRGDTENDDNAAVLAEFERRKLETAARTNMATVPYTIEHPYGTAASAIEYVESLQDSGLDEVMCLIQMGTVPHEVCMETIRQWGTYVIPHFRRGEDR